MYGQRLSRRDLGMVGAGAMASCLAAGACGKAAPLPAPQITARPSATTTTMAAGVHPLDRGGVLALPKSARAPVPLIVLFHGAGGSGSGIMEYLDSVTRSTVAVFLAPDASGRTWDALDPAHGSVIDMLFGQRQFSGFGPDVTSLDAALARTFQAIAVDASRIVAAGFSDGATYALSLGLANGAVFRRIVAFSPGFVLPGTRRERPDVFVSHGRGDEILPIERCSRRIVPELQRAGYDVTYREFDGGHDIPEAVAREAISWAIR